MPDGTCSTPDCGKPVRCKGLCKPCYARMLYRASRPLRRVPCKNCGEEFTPRNHKNVICTEVCQILHQGRRQGAVMKAARSAARIWDCLQCGTDISRKRSDAKFCSDPCANRWDLENNRERIYASSRAWQAAHPELVKEYQRRRRDSDRAGYNANQAAWRRRHKERLKSYRAEFMKTWDPEGAKRRIYLHRRRARRYGNPGSVGVSPRDWARLVNRHDGRCAYCLGHCSELQMEHVIPVARGGRDAIGNVLPSCPGCNQSKNRSLLIEWRLRCRKTGKALPGLSDLALARQAA